MGTEKVMRCVIFSGANIDDYGFVASLLRSDDFVICADSGLRHAVTLGIKADLLVGDFDSADSLPPDSFVKKVTFPCEKDYTDTFAAADAAAKLDPDEVLIFGAIGSRLDHTLGNVGVLEHMHELGISAVLLDSRNEVRLMRDESVSVPRRSDCFLSLIPLDTELKGVTMTGVKYPLDGAVVRRDLTLTVSNEFAAPTAEITVASGTALLMITRD